VSIEQVQAFVSQMHDEDNPAGWLAWACRNPNSVPQTSGKISKPSRLDKAKETAKSQPAPSEIKSERLAEARRLSDSIKPQLEAMRRQDLHDLVASTLRRMIDEGLCVNAYIDLERWGYSQIGTALRVDPLSEETNAIALRAAIAKRIEGYPVRIEVLAH